MGRPALKGEYPYCPPCLGHTSLTWPYLTAKEAGKPLVVPRCKGKEFGHKKSHSALVSLQPPASLTEGMSPWDGGCLPFAKLLESSVHSLRILLLVLPRNLQTSLRRPVSAGPSCTCGRQTERPRGFQSGDLSPARLAATPALSRPSATPPPTSSLRKEPVHSVTLRCDRSDQMHGPFQKYFHFNGFQRSRSA